jgi:hypothetical protein
MARGKLTASIKVAALLLATHAPPLAARMNAAPVKTEETACVFVKDRVSAQRHFPVSAIAFCDIIPAESSPRDYYVLALHSRRDCDGICSTNMGWFAVQKATGRVFEWDVAEDKLGPPVN